jgi:hypothetical protein
MFSLQAQQQLLADKDFDRAMYAMKLVDEVLNCRCLFQLQKWSEENELPVPDKICGLLFYLDDAFADKESTTESLTTVIMEFGATTRAVQRAWQSNILNFYIWNDFLSKPPRLCNHCSCHCSNKECQLVSVYGSSDLTQTDRTVHATCQWSCYLR